MYIRSLEIVNFRAIKKAKLTDLSDMVVIAGPNGCGKTCLFDAIRLVKAACGNYHPNTNELQQYLNEHQININQYDWDLSSLFQDRKYNISIKLEIVLDGQAKRLINDYAKEQLEYSNDTTQINSYGTQTASLNQLGNEAQIVNYKIIPDELVNDSFWVEYTIMPNMRRILKCPNVIRFIFNNYDSDNIGVLDYHGAHRIYQREQIGGINLNNISYEEQYVHSALYNTSNKYSNIKNEMATNFLCEQLDKSNYIHNQKRSLENALKDMFTTFFPGKEFLGPKYADRNIVFNVKTNDGQKHDINELSAGEKEILYGYLRLHTRSLKRSVILFDEPELHLNPKLVKGLPSFYYKHIGKTLGNQIWLLTHSDALLQEAIKKPTYSVFHMQLPGKINNIDNQVSRIKMDDELGKATVELVGDYTALRTGTKIVILEGGGESEFDVTMVKKLFPELVNSAIYLVSGGNKTQVEEYRNIIHKTLKAGSLTIKVYCIVDCDNDIVIKEKVPTKMSWEVYHIENYLLEPKYILQTLQGNNKLKHNDKERMLNELKACAAAIVPNIIQKILAKEADNILYDCINIHDVQKQADIVGAIQKKNDKILANIKKVVNDGLTKENLKKREEEYKIKYQKALSNNEWLSILPGRDILKRLAGKYQVAYKRLRDSIIEKMKNDKYQPHSMLKMMNKIIKDK